MSFQPTIPMAGIAGWRFLERTEASQKASFEKGAALTREVEYFTKNIGKVTSAAELVADRRLLKVALGAFGLAGEIDKKAFIRKVLDEGSTEGTALAVKLTEPAYKKLAAAFGFGDAGGSQTAVAGFAKTITDAYKTRAFEAAVGGSNENMRLALNFKREIGDLATKENASWYSVIGSRSLSPVVEKAFGLPSDSFGKLNVDRQREILREKCSALFGSSDLSVFTDTAKVSKMIDRFLARAQIEEGPTTSAVRSPALTLLQSRGDNGSSGLFNLLLSRR